MQQPPNASADGQPWRCIRTEPKVDLKLFHARFDHVVNPRNGAVARVVVLEADDAVNVVALTPDRHILFVRQYRFGTGTYTLELPGGIIDEGEEPGTAARRELREETGAEAPTWRPLGRIASNPVFMDAYVHHWVAYGAHIAHPLDLDEAEDVALVPLPVEEVRQRLFAGAFDHPHTVNALLLFFKDEAPH